MLYAIICDECNREEDIRCSYDDLVNIKCDNCGSNMRQDYSKKTILCVTETGGKAFSDKTLRNGTKKSDLVPYDDFNSSYSSTKVENKGLSSNEAKKIVSNAYDIAKSRS